MGPSLYFLDSLIKHHLLKGLLLKTLGMIGDDTRFQTHLHPHAESTLGSWLGHTWAWHAPGTGWTRGTGICTYDISKILFTTVMDQRGCFSSSRWVIVFSKSALDSAHLPNEVQMVSVSVRSPSWPRASQNISLHVPDEVAEPVMQGELLGAVTASHHSVTGHNARAYGEYSESLVFCWTCWKTLLSLSLSPHFSFLDNRTLVVPSEKLVFFSLMRNYQSAGSSAWNGTQTYCLFAFPRKECTQETGRLQFCILTSEQNYTILVPDSWKFGFNPRPLLAMQYLGKLLFFFWRGVCVV